MVPATTVLFAIQAGVRLYTTGKEVYTQHVATSAIAFPLLKGLRIDADIMARWLKDEDQRAPDRFSGLYSGAHAEDATKKLRAALERPRNERSRDDDLLIVDAYIALFPHEDAGTAARPGEQGFIFSLNNQEQIALYRVEQWTQGELDKVPSPLWSVAATLVELSVDYFANQPGAVSTKTPQGRALKAFLQAVDENLDFHNTSLSGVVGNLMIAALETVSKHPSLVVGGDAEEKLVMSVTKSMAGSLAKRKDEIAALDSLSVEHLGTILQSVSRAALKAGADTVLEEPGAWFGMDEAESDLVSKVGSTLVDVVLDQGNGLDQIWSVDTLEKLADAAFRAVAAHPGLVAGDDNTGLKRLVGDLASDLAKHDKVISRDALPDVFALVVEHTAGNIEALWGDDFAQGPSHLLVTASRTVLTSLGDTAQDGRWPPELTKADLTKTLDVVFAEVVENKAWLRVDGAESPHLKILLDNVFAVLGSYKLSQINAETGLAIAQSALRATGQNLILMKQVPSEARPFAACLLEAALASIFNSDNATAQWSLVRQSAIVSIVDTTFSQAEKALPTSGVDADALGKKLDKAKAVFQKLASGDLARDKFEKELLSALNT
jgi:hypothetical protein